jgi:hypothetical protein
LNTNVDLTVDGFGHTSQGFIRCFGRAILYMTR